MFSAMITSFMIVGYIAFVYFLQNMLAVKQLIYGMILILGINYNYVDILLSFNFEKIYLKARI